MADYPLYISLGCIFAGILAELLIYRSAYFWQKRRVISGVVLVITAFGAGVFAAQTLSVFGVLLLFVTIYRAINCLRLVDNRINEQYIKRIGTKSFYWLALAQLVIISTWYILNKIDLGFDPKQFYRVAGLVLLVISLIVIISTINNLLHTKFGLRRRKKDIVLPTVTLAISARNEDMDLKQCLDWAVASDYPKLEIIVLDDCSQDKTVQIIKDFAQHGVRFVQGAKEDKTWLEKNKAYQTLLDQAVGDIIIFAGVDVIFESNTISNLIEQFTAKKVYMMSVMPKRTKSGLAAAFVQPMRYWWELAVPKQLLRRPPVLSTCWLADRLHLQKVGGFKSVTHAITPEEHLAAEFSKKSKYCFVRSDDSVGLTTQKDFKNQWETAVRTRYPQLHRRPEVVALRTLLIVIFLLLPFILLLLGAIFGGSMGYSLIIFLLSALLLVASQWLITYVTNPAAVSLLSLVNFPINVILDLVALHISMYRYEFGMVIWKGRDVSTKVMHTIPRLPVID